ncbi:hypothetical protein FGG08_000784 [Glutinoglossum americanum]|uniref:Basic proline-rich protein n=1 Tax=Glutinoglossum americanum TaxID=1670608 RepID=A0A9P8L6P2_9PEZI|nr:hypothetical protein FGG08_000784 [Glutinoglossum americanum]
MDNTPSSIQNERPPSPPSSTLRASPESYNSPYEKTLPPTTPQRNTDPIPSLSPHLPLGTSNISRPRNRSPFSRSHLRSRSSLSSLTPPTMIRAHSMPVVDTGGRIIMPTAVRPSSPLGPPGSNRTPLRKSRDDPFPGTGGYRSSLTDIGGRTTDNGNVDSTSKNELFTNAQNGTAFSGNNFQLRHRPVSPLRQLSQPPSFGGFSTPTWTSSSPLSSHAKYNEPHPLSSNYPASFSSNSSMPSTPTSCRSRSPSISSLETIADSPDAEEAALEAERLAKLKAAAAAADAAEAATNGPTSGDTNAQGRGGLDVPGAGGRAGIIGLGPGFGSRDKRKRWSVCGAERRGDLDLETIWED